MNSKFAKISLTAVLVLAATLVGTALADGTLDWTGQGTTTDGALNSPLCGDAHDYGSITQLPPGADANHYLLWIFTVGNGNTITSATLTTNDDETTWPDDAWTTSAGNQIKFITKAYDLSTL